MEYIPQPIDTSNIEVGKDIIELTEFLAKNVHETWAKQCINDGWTYGIERNDTDKKHPCLIEYEELPESEKEYDRNTAIETLKLIIALGYKISKY